MLQSRKLCAQYFVGVSIYSYLLLDTLCSRAKSGISEAGTGARTRAAVEPPRAGVCGRVERFGCRATESFESFESLNDQNSVKILSEFRKS